jgi:hypothetical protein
LSNNNEMDFFNSVYCGLRLPDGLGRFTWRFTAWVLNFTLISDNCTRAYVLTDRGWKPHTRGRAARRLKATPAATVIIGSLTSAAGLVAG